MPQQQLPIPEYTQAEIDAILTEWGGPENFRTWLDLALRSEAIRRYQTRLSNQHPLAAQTPRNAGEQP